MAVRPKCCSDWGLRWLPEIPDGGDAFYRLRRFRLEIRADGIIMYMIFMIESLLSCPASITRAH